MRTCAVCGCNIEERHVPAIRCEQCQENYRKWWRKNYDYRKKITKLGGQPITLKEIREYKGKKLPNKCFRKGNEVDK